MPRMRFLAVSSDPRPDHAGTTYGPGHETDYVEADYEYIKSLLLEGKAELLDGAPAALLAPPQQAKLSQPEPAKTEASKQA